jgi:hypothetical protein
MDAVIPIAEFGVRMTPVQLAANLESGLGRLEPLIAGAKTDPAAYQRAINTERIIVGEDLRPLEAGAMLLDAVTGDREALSRIEGGLAGAPDADRRAVMGRINEARKYMNAEMSKAARTASAALRSTLEERIEVEVEHAGAMFDQRRGIDSSVRESFGDKTIRVPKDAAFMKEIEERRGVVRVGLRAGAALRKNDGSRDAKTAAMPPPGASLGLKADTFLSEKFPASAYSKPLFSDGQRAALQRFGGPAGAALVSADLNRNQPFLPPWARAVLAALLVPVAALHARTSGLRRLAVDYGMPDPLDRSASPNASDQATSGFQRLAVDYGMPDPLENGRSAAPRASFATQIGLAPASYAQDSAVSPLRRAVGTALVPLGALALLTWAPVLASLSFPIVLKTVLFVSLGIAIPSAFSMLTSSFAVRETPRVPSGVAYLMATHGMAMAMVFGWAFGLPYPTAVVGLAALGALSVLFSGTLKRLAGGRGMLRSWGVGAAIGAVGALAAAFL